MKHAYKYLACGGTFDRLHEGHKVFLSFVFEKSALVTIGLSSDKLVLLLNKNGVLPFVERKKSLIKFLKEEKLFDRAMIIELKDIYGTTLNDKNIEVLAVTDDTYENGVEINKRREELGLEKLDLIKFNLVKVDEEIISSSKIRGGLINRNGEIYLPLKDYHMPGNLRKSIGKPQGVIMNSLDVKEFNNRFLVSVGDMVTKSFMDGGIIPNLSIVDFVINRKEIYKEIGDIGFNSEVRVVNVKNKRGMISKELAGAIKDYFKTPTGSLVIRVDGEEDLAVVPVVLCAPLGSLVFYGHRLKGVVCVEVTEKKKDEFKQILSLFN